MEIDNSDNKWYGHTHHFDPDAIIKLDKNGVIKFCNHRKPKNCHGLICAVSCTLYKCYHGWKKYCKKRGWYKKFSKCFNEYLDSLDVSLDERKMMTIGDVKNFGFSDDPEHAHVTKNWITIQLEKSKTFINNKSDHESETETKSDSETEFEYEDVNEMIEQEIIPQKSMVMMHTEVIYIIESDDEQISMVNSEDPKIGQKRKSETIISNRPSKKRRVVFETNESLADNETLEIDDEPPRRNLKRLRRQGRETNQLNRKLKKIRIYSDEDNSYEK